VLRPGEKFQGYVVGAVVGHGGFATVYRAHHASGDEHFIALKVLADDHHGPAEFFRLQREFDFADRVRHPHVVSVERCGAGWLAMRFVDGGTLAATQPLENRLTALAQIAEALDYVHRCGIVHCDVKPTNILVYKDFSEGGAVLIDFGVAHALAEDYRKRPQQVQASLPYIAPEVLLGHIPQAATDQYGLACTAVELLTGAAPFDEPTASALINAHLDSAPPQVSRKVASLPRAVDSIVCRAMAKDPEMRYESCTEFVAMLTKVLR
jgi:serine/threonine protein kinase